MLDWLSNNWVLCLYLFVGLLTGAGFAAKKHRENQHDLEPLHPVMLWVISIVFTLLMLVLWLPIVVWSQLALIFPEWNSVTIECHNCKWDSEVRVTTSQMEDGFVVVCKHCQEKNDINRQDTVLVGS
jgi:hypothetical protein